MTDLHPADLGLVLSLRDGQVWVSWPDDRMAVRLGEHAVVLAVMQDFIRQSELGDRLLNRVPKDSDGSESSD